MHQVYFSSVKLVSQLKVLDIVNKKAMKWIEMKSHSLIKPKSKTKDFFSMNEKLKVKMKCQYRSSSTGGLNSQGSNPKLSRAEEGPLHLIYNPLSFFGGLRPYAPSSSTKLYLQTDK